MNLDELKDGTFTVWQPNAVDLIKGGTIELPENALAPLGGYSSTASLDRQGEEVFQKGLDFSEFVQWGWYNDNHQQHTAAAVGVPTLAEYRPGKGWWTEGYLLRGITRALDIYNLAKSLAGTMRKLGFSIEGKILERLGNKILKAIIRNVAITNSPVNTDCTWDLLAKSWGSDLDVKALSVGHARVADSGGRVLVPEDLESGEIKYVYYCPHCKKAFDSTGHLDDHIEKSHAILAPITSGEYPNVIRRTAKSLTREQAMAYIKTIRPEYSDKVCAQLIDYVFTQAA